MEIRLATKEDIPQITELRKTQDTEGLERNFQEVEAGKGAYLIAEEEGKVVGQLFLKYYGKLTAPDYPDIEGVLVSEQVRGQGIGTKLIERAEELAGERGFNKTGLAVNPTLNPKAKALYERLGYKDVGNKPYLDGVYDGTEDWVVDMIKEL